MSELKEKRYIIEIAKVQGVAKAAENLFISDKNRRNVWSTAF